MPCKRFRIERDRRLNKDASIDTEAGEERVYLSKATSSYNGSNLEDNEGREQQIWQKLTFL